jgi:F-type H+-transporting ATPase subunit delta
MTSLAATDPAVEGYARAIVEVARAEGVLDRVDDELYTFARAVTDNPPLRERLLDERLGIAPRLEVVEGLLTARAHPQTIAIATYVVQSGRVRQIGEIAEAVTRIAAAERQQAVAEVRSAVELNGDQRERLAAALEKTTGRRVSVKAVVDRSVVGGLVVTMGDEVIDGSIARRLADLRAAATST